MWIIDHADSILQLPWYQNVIDGSVEHYNYVNTLHEWSHLFKVWVSYRMNEIFSNVWYKGNSVIFISITLISFHAKAPWKAFNLLIESCNYAYNALVLGSILKRP